MITKEETVRQKIKSKYLDKAMDECLVERLKRAKFCIIQMKISKTFKICRLKTVQSFT